MRKYKVDAAGRKVKCEVRGGEGERGKTEGVEGRLLEREKQVGGEMRKAGVRCSG